MVAMCLHRFFPFGLVPCFLPCNIPIPPSLVINCLCDHGLETRQVPYLHGQFFVQSLVEAGDSMSMAHAGVETECIQNLFCVSTKNSQIISVFLILNAVIYL